MKSIVSYFRDQGYKVNWGKNSYTDKGTGWEVRVRLAKVHLVPVLSDGFNILISDRDVFT